MYKNKRGQAAMEFLMTYGWAILAAIVAIGALAYFGVFSPSKYIPETCMIGVPFGCDNDESFADSTTERNGFNLSISVGGEDYYIHIVNITNCGSKEFGATPLYAPSGSKNNILVRCPLTKGANVKGSITIVYNKVGVDRNLTSTGTISKKVI